MDLPFPGSDALLSEARAPQRKSQRLAGWFVTACLLFATGLRADRRPLSYKRPVNYEAFGAQLN